MRLKNVGHTVIVLNDDDKLTELITVENFLEKIVGETAEDKLRKRIFIS